MPSETGHLHPFTLLLETYRQLSVLFLPVLLSGFQLQPWMLFLAFGALLTLAGAMIRYLFFQYRIGEGELVTIEGWLQRVERHVPVERVQDIYVERGILHRLLGVARVVVETGSGEEPEAVLSVVSMADAERLRAELLTARARARNGGELPAEEVEGPPEEVLHRLPARELILAGASSSGAGLVAGGVYAFVELTEDLYPQVVGRVFDWGQALLTQLLGASADSIALIVLVAAVAALIVGVPLSVGYHFLLYHRFQLTRHQGDLRRRYGLLTQRARTLPARRVQCLRLDESWIRRLLGRGVLHGVSAGGNPEDEGDDGRTVLVPLGRVSRLQALTGELMPNLDPTPSSIERVSRHAIRRTFLKGAIGVVALVGGLSLGLGWDGLWGLVGLPLAYGLAHHRYRQLGYLLGPDHLRIRVGWLGRSTWILPLSRLQTVAVKQTPFDRRLELATLEVDLAGAHGPSLPHLPAETARELARRLAARSAGTSFQWV